MKATFKTFSRDGKIAANRKEKDFVQEWVVLVTNKAAGRALQSTNRNNLTAILRVRIYATKAQHYACVWISSPKYILGRTEGIYNSGGGKAGGYGYHRASAALSNALDDAGIELSEAIDGCGESAMIDAIASIARALGYRSFHIHNAHA